jgi:hypothetical protein
MIAFFALPTVLSLGTILPCPMHIIKTAEHSRPTSFLIYLHQLLYHPHWELEDMLAQTTW